MNNGRNTSGQSGTSGDQIANISASADHLLTTPVHEAFSWAPDMVIYHDKCADGIVAAWACWRRWGDTPNYIAANYGFQPPSDVAGKNILIVDFSYKADDLRAMVAAGAKSIVILDHHETAQAALKPFACWEATPGFIHAEHMRMMVAACHDQGSPPILAIFDMGRSGARMAWDFALNGIEAPQLVLLAERYDLWRFSPNTLDDAELLHLDIQAGPLTIERMESIHDELEDGDRTPINRGRVIETWRQPLIREIAARAHLGTVGGVEGVITVECPYSLVSAVGHYLLGKHPAAPFAAMSVTAEKAVSWSLRSAADRQSVSDVSSRFGGGGHRNAAGFRVERPNIEEMLKDKARLDYLDRCNAALNAKYGSDYRWELIQNNNVNRLMLGHLEVDLNDSAANGLPSCRDAIDQRVRESEDARRA